MMQALAAVPVGFLRIIGFVLFWLMSRLAATERAKARLWQRQIQKYGPVVCSALLALSLAHTHKGESWREDTGATFLSELCAEWPLHSSQNPFSCFIF